MGRLHKTGKGHSQPAEWQESARWRRKRTPGNDGGGASVVLDQEAVPVCSAGLRIPLPGGIWGANSVVAESVLRDGRRRCSTAGRCTVTQTAGQRGGHPHDV